MSHNGVQGRTLLTRLRLRNFRGFDEAEIELGERVVFVGPNNSGKTTALQALLLWHHGVNRWLERRGEGAVPEKRPGVTLNRRDLVSLPVPSANLLWKNLRVREGSRVDGKSRTENVLIEIEVSGLHAGKEWQCAMQFDYANAESFYCRPPKTDEGSRAVVPGHLANLKLAYLPPMSGLAASEVRLDEGAIQVRIGEGRTAETVRNLCWLVLQAPDGPRQWKRIVASIEQLFGARLDEPKYLRERGEIELTFRTREGVRLDLSSAGRGQQQTLLLLAHLSANPGSVLLLDEPDAHLEVLRQRQIYQTLSEAATDTGGQLLAASHSEVILNEAAGRDTVVAFVGRPHRIDNRAQVRKALTELGFEQYYQAEQQGWVLYLEGSTDLAILQAFARALEHRTAEKALELPFVHYVENQARKAQEHFHGLREAVPSLRGYALFDRLERTLPEDSRLPRHMWRRREIENYLCRRDTLLAWADDFGSAQGGPLFANLYRETMETVIDEMEQALATLGRSSPWSDDIKATDDFLDPLFARYFQRLGLENLMRKTNYHTLARSVPPAEIPEEVREVLDGFAAVSEPSQSV